MYRELITRLQDGRWLAVPRGTAEAFWADQRFFVQQRRFTQQWHAFSPVDAHKPLTIYRMRLRHELLQAPFSKPRTRS